MSVAELETLLNELPAASRDTVWSEIQHLVEDALDRAAIERARGEEVAEVDLGAHRARLGIW